MTPIARVQINLGIEPGARERLESLAAAFGYVKIGTAEPQGNLTAFLNALSRAKIDDAVTAHGKTIMRVLVIPQSARKPEPALKVVQPASAPPPVAAPTGYAPEFPPPFRRHNLSVAEREKLPRRPRLWQCNQCGRNLPFTPEYFALSRTAKYGLRYECLQCRHRANVAMRERQRAAAQATPTAAPGAGPTVAKVPSKPRAARKPRATAVSPVIPAPVAQAPQKRGWLHRLLYGNYENVG